MSAGSGRIAVWLAAALVGVPQMAAAQMDGRRGRESVTTALLAAVTLMNDTSDECIRCHKENNPGIVAQWEASTHAENEVTCIDCHQSSKQDPDSFDDYGARIATVVTPRDCSSCHQVEYEEFERSHHAAAGNILHSLDNFLAETVEGARRPFNPHSPTPGRGPATMVNGMASVALGCKQCHGSRVALRAKDGGRITVDDLKPGPDGLPTNRDAVGRILRDKDGRAELSPCNLAQYGHRAAQPGRIAGVVLGLPQSARFFAAASETA